MVNQSLTGWRSTASHSPGGVIELEQRVLLSRPVVEMSEVGARRLGDRYWQVVEDFTYRLVRAHREAGEVELRLLGRWPLLRFGLPEIAVDSARVRCRFPILGGLLVRLPTGSITFSQTSPPTVELCSTVSGFVPSLAAKPGRPSWRGALYEHVQRRLHVSVSRRYFERLIDEAT